MVTNEITMLCQDFWIICTCILDTMKIEYTSVSMVQSKFYGKRVLRYIKKMENIRRFNQVSDVMFNASEILVCI